MDIKMIVGENLHRLSSLEGATLEVYIEKVLPGLLDLVEGFFLFLILLKD